MADSSSQRPASGGFPVTPHGDSRQTVVGPVADKIIAGRYSVLREIGRGGMGVVYLAQDEKLNRYVAIKRLMLRGRSTEDTKRRFLREAQTIASLGHFHIVNVFDIGRDEVGYYITMEYVAGPPLSQEDEAQVPPPPVSVERAVKTQGPFNGEDAKRLMVKLLSAIDYAHGRGIIHRDLKPSNVLLDPHREPKVVDFGLARAIRREDSELTREGMPLGTPEYASPEQWSDASAVDERADIYALAGVYWFMLTGEMPRYFRESALPTELRPVLLHAFARLPEDRFQNVKAFLQAVEGTAAVAIAIGPPLGLSTTGSGTAESTALVHWNCQHCQQPNPDSARYCIHCGTFGMRNCPLCDAEIRIGIRFCPECGADVESAEQASEVIMAAKNQANFLEYEAALETVRDLNKEHSEIGQLAKNWRGIVLQRRNLLTDLDSAVRVFNLDKAVRAATDLAPMVPLECLSDSPDYEVCIRYEALREQLRTQLHDAAERAYEEHSLERYARFVNAMIRVFGREPCEALFEQLAAIRAELDNAVTQAGLAMGMNCLSSAMATLTGVRPWRGTELGERRTRLHAKCAELGRQRDALIDEMEGHLRNAAYLEALACLGPAMRFQLPPKHVEAQPAPDDLAANRRLQEIDKEVLRHLVQLFRDWVEQDRWLEIGKASQLLAEGEAGSWKRALEKLQRTVRAEVVKRYDRAVEQEKRGHFLSADRAWRRFLEIPKDLCPTNFRVYASDFVTRSESFDRAHRYRMNRRLVVLLCVLWVYPLWRVGDNAVGRLLGVGGSWDSAWANCLPVAIQLWVFAVLAATRRLKSFPRNVLLPYMPRMEFDSLLTCMLAAVSPLAWLASAAAAQWLPELSHWLPQLVPSGVSLQPWVMLAAVGCFWLLMDVAWARSWRVPGAVALTLSWAVAVVVWPPMRDGGGAGRWAVAALVQGATFAALHGCQYLFMRLRRPAAESRPPDEGSV